MFVLKSRYKLFRILADSNHINGIPDVLIILTCLIVSFILILRLTNLYGFRDKSFFFLAYMFHMLIAGYFYYIMKNAIIYSDSAHFYLRAVEPGHYPYLTRSFNVGSNFIVSIVYFFYNYFNVSYLSLYFTFATLGFFGFGLFCYLVKASGYLKSDKWLGVYLIPVLLFTPNQHMWVSPLGKDSIMFFALMLFTFSLTHFRKYWFYLLLSSFLIFMVRPHIFVFCIASLVIVLIVWGNFSSVVKVPLVFVSSIVGYVALNFLLVNVMKTDLSLAAIIEIVEERQGYYADEDYGGSTVNTANYPFLYKWFSYLYRPLFERINLNFIFIGIDNLISIFFTLCVFQRGFFRYIRSSPIFIKFSFVYFILATFFFASIFSNFGIAVRQKCMFIFSFYIIIAGFLAWRREQRSSTIRTNPIPKLIAPHGI